MEDIFISDLSPDTASINSASGEIVATVDYSLLLKYTAAPNRVITNDPTYLLYLKHVAHEA